MMDMRQTRISVAAVSFLLLCVGVVMIYSASAINAYETIGDSAYYLKRHLVYMLIGFIGTFAVMRLDYQLLSRWAKPLLLCAVALLIVLLLPGISREIGGARRWFRLGGLSFQPSEFAKLAMLVYTADFIARRKTRLHSFRQGFLPLLSVLLLVSGCILLQPDLGTVVAVSLVFFVLCFIGGVRPTHMALVALAALPALYVLIFKVAYRRSRILAFLNPWEDPQGIGFQIIQSLVAFGSGGWLGTGLGQGKQKLLYLPAAYTDFIFSIIGEELGFIGTASIVLLVMVLLIQGARISLRARDTFGQLLSFGLVSSLIIEAMINIGVVTSIFPTKGLPFPFISYGGTSLVFNMIYVGLILNVGRKSS
ncbi:MAG: putative lipid II flippase FtsW [Candidatus Omnitrophica bacterium]|nr:putative lipid II flippase FtsW [Candidatus Omnitrophota bacterium]